MKKKILLAIALFGTVTAFSQATNSSTQVPVADSQQVPVHKVKAMEEVTISSGYFKQKIGGVNTAVTHIKGKSLRNLATQDVATALQGRVAGLEVISASGEPGAPAQITIRGVASLTQTPPLYIVDGVQQLNGLNMNMADIESIDVLKDAAACAIYGSNAAGGVIIITTRSGGDDDDTADQ